MQSLPCKVVLLSILLALCVNSQGLPFYFDPMGKLGGASFTPLSLNPVSWWQGNGNALDSASTNNGTWAGTTTYTSGRDSRQAFRFNGNSRIEIGNPNNLQISNAVSLVAWVKPTSYTSYQAIMGPGILADFVGYGMYLAEFGILYQRRLNAISSVVSFQTDAINNWIMVASVDDGTTRSIYIDGILRNTITNNLTGYPNRPWGIGQAFSGGLWRFGFVGPLQDVMVFNRVLTQTEITQLYNWMQ